MAARKKAAASGDGTGHGTGKKRRGNPANLRPPWKKGESGNPRGGKPSPYTEAIRKALPPDEFATIVTKQARGGDSRVIVALLDRHYPKPEVALKLEHSGPDGGPIAAALEVHFVKPEDEDET